MLHYLIGAVWKPRRSSCQAHAKAIDKQLRHTKPGVVDVSGPRVPLSGAFMFIQFVTPSFYIIARIYLLTEALIALRNLHPGAFVQVQWTSFLPHI